MAKKRRRLKKKWRIVFNVLVITIILFSVNKTRSNYNTSADISMQNAIPIVNIEASNDPKTIEFNEYGWLVYNFDIVNGKLGKDGLFYVNEVDMEYYINIVKDSGDLNLNAYNLYTLDDDSILNKTPVPYVEGKGYGPFDLPYKQDDETVLNKEGYIESKYIERKHFAFVYKYGECEVGDQNCVVNAKEAGTEFKFHVEVKAYQK